MLGRIYAMVRNAASAAAECHLYLQVMTTDRYNEKLVTTFSPDLHCMSCFGQVGQRLAHITPGVVYALRARIVCAT